MSVMELAPVSDERGQDPGPALTGSVEVSRWFESVT